MIWKKRLKQADMAENTKIFEEIYLYLVDKAPVLFLTLSPDGEITGANRYAKSFTGRPLIRESFQDIIVDFTGKLNLSAVMSDPPEERLINISNASGLPQSFYFSFKPVKDIILAIGRLDAEELENMRKEVLSLNQELNNLMRQLHKTNAKLKLLNEEKNRFLGMAAHDLRKPIGLVITYSEFLIDEAESVLSGEHIDFLNTINKSCSFMKRLVDDFLDVSAIEAGRFDLDLQLVAIDDVLDRSLKLNGLQAGKKEVALQVDCEDNMPRIWMDESKIEQAIINLVSNAIEHTRIESTVKISLRCDDQFITFSVVDQGPGITSDEQEQLFKPFSKTSAKKTGGEKSTGLGMLITRKIIESHGGNIWIESQMGEGTTVCFRMPVKTGENEQRR